MAFKMKYNGGGFPFKKTDEDPDTYKLGLDELGESPAPKDHSKYFSGKFPVHKDYNHPAPGFKLWKGKVNFKRFIDKFRKK